MSNKKYIDDLVVGIRMFSQVENWEDVTKPTIVYDRYQDDFEVLIPNQNGDTRFIKDMLFQYNNGVWSKVSSLVTNIKGD